MMGVSEVSRCGPLRAISGEVTKKLGVQASFALEHFSGAVGYFPTDKLCYVSRPVVNVIPAVAT